MADDDVKQIWATFWEPLILNPEHEALPLTTGVVLTAAQWSQVMRELADFKMIIDVVPSVYSHATGGAMSKATYNDVSQITGCIDEHYEQEWLGTLAEALVELEIDHGSVVDEFVSELAKAVGLADEALQEASDATARVAERDRD